MNHDLCWLITVGKDIKKVCWRHEIESWESSSLGIHKLIKGLFTNSQVLLNLLETWQDVWLDAEIKSFLVLESISKDGLHVLVDSNEFDRLLWQFLLHLLGVDEEVLKERPGSLDLSNNHNDLTD